MTSPRHPLTSGVGLNSLSGTPPHPDDLAIDAFANALKKKLHQKRKQGRRGWDDKEMCPPGVLQQMLLEHLAKGDPIDIGAFAMMIWMRGEEVTGPELERPLREAG